MSTLCTGYMIIQPDCQESISGGVVLYTSLLISSLRFALHSYNFLHECWEKPTGKPDREAVNHRADIV